MTAKKLPWTEVWDPRFTLAHDEHTVSAVDDS